MPERSTERRPADVRQGLLSRLFTLLAQGIQWLLLSLLFSILIEWIGMVLWWPDQGLDHSRQMLAAELGYLSADFSRSLITEDPAQFTAAISNRVYYALFEVTHIARVINWASDPSAAQGSAVASRLHAFVHPVTEYALAAMQITQVFAVRLAILLLALPLFGMFALIAIVDGLVQRDLRRWSGGRESSFVYHWAKRAALPLLVLAWVVYLALPFSLHPSVVILPFASLFALSIAVTASRFKKYL
jgi:integrating conjugative element membrane protein (TIGR03747 family)